MELALTKRVFIVEDGDARHTEIDPMPGAPIPQVKKILAGKYPSITNANISSPVVDGNNMVYTIMAVGGIHG